MYAVAEFPTQEKQCRFDITFDLAKKLPVNNLHLVCLQKCYQHIKAVRQLIWQEVV